VIIYRLKSGEKGIMTGRSHCGSCNTILKALDLIPIFSWLIHKGKCAHCKKSVSAVYPFLELSAGTLFALI
jgi:leader peptidase (prepilin peptidase)/N-methyltransferase